MPSIRFEICNKCNLACPSCQEGRINFAHQHEPFHYADVELCRKIFERIRAQDEHFDIYLYMFCEPCLHPQLDEILDIMDEYGLTAYISSNLNVKHDWERLLRHPSLKRLTVSISGMSQEIYEKGQRGGNLALLMRNMKNIAALPKELKSKVLIFFHQYNDNAADEEQCRALCAEYGFDFVPSPGFFMYSPWDAVKPQPDALLQDGIDNVFSRMIVQKNFFMEPMPGLADIPCSMEFAKDIAIDSHGNVHHRCCLVPMSKESACGQFLEMPFEDIYNIEKYSKTCIQCKNNGFHVQFSFIPHVEYTMLAKQRSHKAGMPNINERIRAFIKRREPLPSLKNVPVYLYGMVGNAGIITLLQYQGYDVRGIIDDNTAEQGRAYCRLPVISLADVPVDVLSQACIVICFIRERDFIEAFKQKLLAQGAKSVLALYELFLQQK